MNKNMKLRLFLMALLLVLISACMTPKSTSKRKNLDTGPSQPVDWTKVKPVNPKKESKSKYGNPKNYEVFGKTYHVLNSSENFKQHGVASWYGTQFHGRRTSSGETYDMLQLTAAHKTLPIPCYVKVTNKDNGKTLTVRVNDRGPFAKSRIIDLSYSAAYQLGMAEQGTANVMIETISFEHKPTRLNKKKLSNKRLTSKKLTHNKSKNKKEGKYRFVQVGAYSNHASAQKLAKVLDREIKLPVKISSIKRSGKKLYRVRIGPIDNLALAEKLSKTLNIKELGKPSIVYQD
jgi:rare lipoprotein A